MSLINKLDKIDGAKIYAVSLAKDLIKDLTWKSEKNDLLNSIISAKTTEEAYNLVGFNDNTSNLPFLPVQNNSFYYPEPQLNLINSYPPYPINNKGYLPKIGFDNLQNENQNFPSYYPQPQPNIVSPYPHYQTNKNEPIVHNHYYVNESNNNENLNDNNKHSTEKESADEEIGTLEWLGALAVMAFGIFGTFSSLNSDEKKSSIISHEDSYHQNNYSENKFFDEKPSAPYYDKLYPDISFYDKDDLPSYNDLPPSYESLFGSK
jgi:hypothetical protein